MLIADEAYAHDSTRRKLWRRKIAHTIPEPDAQIVRRAPEVASAGFRPAFDKQAYRQRNVVKRCFNRFKQWRDRATCYTKRATSCRSTLRTALPIDPAAHRAPDLASVIGGTRPKRQAL
jgi:transposase